MRLPFALPALTPQRRYIGAVIAVLAVFAVLAMAFGFISWDSWYYIFLAQALRHGQGCMLDSDYSAIYPCGYPAFLALTAPVTSLPGFMISSKITNLLLLGLSFAFIYKASRNLLMSTLVAVNPVTLTLFMYTWSENLLLFAFAGSLFAISRLDSFRATWRWYAALAAFLIIGCSARYFFGPFAVFLFAATYIGFGWKTALRALPCFCLAGIAYLAYQQFNITETGFGTGMARTAAPESPWLLTRQFFETAWANSWPIAVSLLLLAGLNYKQVTIAKAQPSPGRAAALFILTAGLGFLALAFTLRVRTFFDPFNTRTIGYGLVLTVAGLTGFFVRLDEKVQPLPGLIAAAVFAVAAVEGGALPQYFVQAIKGDYHFPAASLAAMKGDVPPADTVFYFELPDPDINLERVDTTPNFYYGNDVDSEMPEGHPDKAPDAASNYVRKLRQAAKGRCFVDFTPYDTPADFADYLNATTLIDRRFSLKTWRFSEVTEPNLDPSLKTYLMAVFQPGRMAPCSGILALPASQPILAKLPPASDDDDDNE